MKLLHLSDLHLGKRFNEASLQDDQKYILGRALEAVREEKPDAVLIAGDIYDKQVPPIEAVALWHEFLTRLTGLCAHVFVLPGNHDSPERVTQYAGLTDQAGLHLAPVYGGAMKPITLRDEYGEVDVWQLPFIRPVSVRRFFPEAVIDTYTDAARAALSGCTFTPGRRNVLSAHQYVNGAERSDSDTEPVGGLDTVDVSAFDGFDYVALGHIHRAQSVTENGRIHYCGAPLKYTFGECDQQKSLTVAELDGAGKVTLRAWPLIPLREVRKLRGSFEELMNGQPCEDYIHLTLTDENEVPDAMNRLKQRYRNALQLTYDNSRTRNTSVEWEAADIEKQPLELFGDYFRQQAGREASAEEMDYMKKIISIIWEEEDA
ncbi:MAG: exonuclease SbcCD subunit D [Clostridia bacterium]|nr:exonuclease SbcCD subunit D [Clostridia bacterium]